MSTNTFIPQIADPKPMSFSDSAGSLPRREQPATEIGSRKNFSAVLHTVHREQDTEPSRKTSEQRPSDATDRTDRAERMKTPEVRSCRQQESESHQDKIEEGKVPDRGAPESAAAPGTALESTERADPAHPDLLDGQRALIENPIPVPSMEQSDVAKPDSEEGSLQSGAEDQEGAALNQTPVGLALAAATGLLPGHAATCDLLVPDGQPQSVTKQEGLPENKRALAAEMVSGIDEAAGHGVQSGLEGVEEKATDLHGGSQSVPAPTGLPPALHQAGLDPNQKLQGSPIGLMPENTPPPPTSDSGRPSQGVQPERPASEIVQANAQFLLQKDAQDTKLLPAVLHDQPVVADGARQSEMDWFEQGGRQKGGGEPPFSHRMAASDAPATSAHAAYGETVIAGAAAHSSSRPIESSVAPVPAPPPSPLDAGEMHLHAAARSVVFEVAQPDLGHVNVRVTMANEMVHAYLSSDRADVGQFLINGQDRLQTALQANGLEMGQFRVDIDRQQTGRSFQQGQSHEQGRAWNQSGSHHDGEHHAEPYDNRQSWSQGMLNLVA